MSAPLGRAAGKVAVRRDRFPGLSARAYGLIVDGDGMRPRFASGDVLVIDPDKVPAAGDFVVIYDGGKIAEYPGEPGLFHVIVGKETP